MKKIINVALFIFFAVTVAILVAGLLFYQNNQSQINPNNKISPSPNCNLTITTAEVDPHNNPADCWVIVDNQIYNVTNFLNMHPAGAGTILPVCGQDATQLFNSVRKHNQGSLNILQDYCVGTLSQN